MTLNDLLVVVGIGLAILALYFVLWLSAREECAERILDLEERLGSYERDNLPDRNDETGRFEKRD